MKLVDHYTQEEVSDIQIGQDVDLIIDAVTKGRLIERTIIIKNQEILEKLFFT